MPVFPSATAATTPGNYGAQPDMHGLQFDFNYVLSKSLDVGSDSERVPEFGGLSAIITHGARTSARSFGLRYSHQINSNWVYDLPFGRGKRFGHDWNRATNTMLGGWQIAGIYRWTSGFPFTIRRVNLEHQLPTIRECGLTGAVKQKLTYVNGQPFAFDIGAAANDPTELPITGIA